MLVGGRLAGFEFDDQAIFYKQVRVVIAEHSSVFVLHRQRMLLLDRDAVLPEPIHQSVFVNLLEMAASMVLVNCKTCFPNDVTKRVDVVPSHFCAFLCFLWQFSPSVADHAFCSSMSESSGGHQSRSK